MAAKEESKSRERNMAPPPALTAHASFSPLRTPAHSWAVEPPGFSRSQSAQGSDQHQQQQQQLQQAQQQQQQRAESQRLPLRPPLPPRPLAVMAQPSSDGSPVHSYVGSPVPLRAPESTPTRSTPNATPPSMRSGGGPFMRPSPPAASLNLASQLAQLDFGRARAYSPGALGPPGGHGGGGYGSGANGGNGSGGTSPAALTPSCSPVAERAVQPYGGSPGGTYTADPRDTAPAPTRPGLLRVGAGGGGGVGGYGVGGGGGLRRSSSAGEMSPPKGGANLRPPGIGGGPLQRKSWSDSHADEEGVDVVIDISPAINPYLLHYATPAPDDGRTVRCSIVRTRGKKRLVGYALRTEAGEEMLTAVRRGDDFWISMTASEALLPAGPDGCASRPPDWKAAQRATFSILRCPPESAFTSAPDGSRLDFWAYAAASNGRELLAVGEPLLALSHGTVVASEDLPQVNTMRIAFPDPADGSPLCTRAYLADALDSMEDIAADDEAAAAAAAVAGAGADDDDDDDDGQQSDGEAYDEASAHRRARSPPRGALRIAGGVAVLDSRVPVWNARTESYALNFHGRATLASSKNIQLLHWPDGRPPRTSASPGVRAASELPTLLYGKVDKDAYNLDYSYPLSAYHAFVVAISVTDW